jgi:hypothetical protein
MVCNAEEKPGNKSVFYNYEQYNDMLQKNILRREQNDFGELAAVYTVVPMVVARTYLLWKSFRHQFCVL